MKKCEFINLQLRGILHGFIIYLYDLTLPLDCSAVQVTSLSLQGTA